MAREKKLPLQTSNNANVAAAAQPDMAGAAPHKTIEEMYQKKSQLEHILLRPDTYVGSIEKHTQTLWVYENDEMVYRPVSYVPGLYKIFDEILVNAADNKQRDPSMDSIKVSINVEENCVSVYNNGAGVPVEIHQEEKVYVPELIFGHLLTSSNYDDAVKKTTGGRNGYGAKLTNIFSTEFVIETADGKRQKKYKQVFSNNMGKKSEPVITKCNERDNWTKVTFKPDLAKFNMTHLDEDVFALMKKRVVDMAGCLGDGVKVELNGRRVAVKSFRNYVDLYLKSSSRPVTEGFKSLHAKVNDRWEICVSLSEGQFQQVSFANSIATIKGGTHVDYVTNQITNHIAAIVNKKKKNANLKAHTVKNYLWVFVNALIDNPAFDSQTKETLTIRQSSFGSKCELSNDFLKSVEKQSGIVEALLSWADFKQNKDLKKTDGAKKQKVLGVDKLEDANDAGGKYSAQCTLILTEGDSAKALAMAGISVVGRDRYGVFPLRGKLLNVREASALQITNNAEITNIKKILGLQQNKVYDSINSLRYGHLMIMTDQDHDGSHIKGLLINFIHTFWPSLLQIPSFLVEFITPIVKATHKKGKVLSFYTMPEYESWKESLGADASGWTIKYYKGLGTSTSQEGKQYFSDLNKHKKDFMWVDELDGQAIELAFSKKKIEARKNWLRQFEPGTFLDQKEKLIKYSDFVNKELILFSRADLERSIPSMLDGMKPGQRKILFCAFKRNLVKEAKIAQFSGYVSEHSAYHHGEQSLMGTIIGMAQDYVGSNNINLLLPNGQFGTRRTGGKDHASARYIYTQLSPITRFIFPKEDDLLLDYLNEDGQSIEPTWYMPVIPMVLVNGCEGIGTGWSSYIPNYNPKSIVKNLRHLLNGEIMEPMEPWYRGFKGTIDKSATKEGGVTYTVTGAIEEVNETTLRITELPVRRWTQDYKEFLESITEGNAKEKEKAKDPIISEIRDHSDDTAVDIEVTLPEEKLLMAKQEGLLKTFKLTTTVSISNMHLFDPKGVIKKYDTPEQILEEFFHIRLQFYEKRKKILLDNLELELLKLENKVRFILGVVSGEIIVSNRKRAELVLELQEKRFTPFPKKSKSAEAVVAGATDVATEENDDDSPVGSEKSVRISDYDYLLSMSIGTLTLEKVQELCADRDKVNNQVDDLRKATPMSLWAKDLDALEGELDEQEKSDARSEETRKETKNKLKVGPTKKAPRPTKNPPKTNKKTSNAEVSEPVPTSSVSAMDSDTVSAVVKPKGRAGSKKAPVKKKEKSTIVSDDDEDEEVLDLKQRLAAYNLGSSPDNSLAMDTEDTQVAVTKKQPSKRAAAQKSFVISDDSEDVEDDDFDLEEVNSPVAKKPAAKVKAPPKPPVAAKKRGPANRQAKLTEMLKPAENLGISPEKKVRKMRESPFNKKSSSVLGRVSEVSSSTISEEMLESMSISENGEESVEAMPTRARNQRGNRRMVSYVLSDSESEKASDDSDFAQDESD